MEAGSPSGGGRWRAPVISRCERYRRFVWRVSFGPIWSPAAFVEEEEEEEEELEEEGEKEDVEKEKFWSQRIMC